MKELSGFFIDGAIAPPAGAEKWDVVSPATEEVYGTIPVATVDDVDRAVVAAREAFDDGRWSLLQPSERVAILDRAADILDGRVAEIAETQANEIGTPVAFGQAIVEQSIGTIRKAGRIALEAPSEERRDGAWEYLLRREPVGVVAMIAPWNGAFFFSCAKGSTALAAGCTVIDKPAIEAPFSPMFLAEALRDAGLPAGVFNLIPADREVGEALVTHPLVDKVSFTGSSAAGRKIASACGERLKGTLLELGGKSAAIVLEDADLDTVATAVASGVFFHTGQVCAALSRVITPRDRYEETVEALVSEAANWPVGDPFSPSSGVGPLASKRQYERVSDYVELGKAEGAVIAVGGGSPEGLERGYYFAPTVFRDVSNSMKIAREEIFGPVVVVIPYDTEEEAVEIANDSEFGLHGAVFTGDEERALEIAKQIRTGTFTLNGFTMNGDAPLGGVKGSGIGTMNAVEGFEQYRVLKTVNLRPTDADLEPEAVA